MIELVASLMITGSSVLLFAYWFRYVCVLILSARTARDYTAMAASANQLGFLGVQSLLRAGPPGDLERLKDTLDRDYRILTYLLMHSAHPLAGGDGVEKRLLRIDYRLMGAWFSLVRPFSPAAACRALDEMSRVVAHFANAMGERAGAAA
jgi:hypothetical protein